MDEKALMCTIKPVFHVQIGDHKVDFHSGCSVIDVTFPNTFYVEIGEIHFKNYYTAWLSIKAKKKSIPGEGEAKWKTLVPKFLLMPYPHCDQASENYFTITSKQMLWQLQNVVALRFILRQPSPLWKDFKIDDIRLYKTSISMPPDVTLPSWITESTKEETDRQLKGIPSIPVVSKDLQQMWALTDLVKNNQPTARVGRYDIDGSYEINLLSYT